MSLLYPFSMKMTLYVTSVKFEWKMSWRIGRRTTFSFLPISIFLRKCPINLSLRRSRRILGSLKKSNHPLNIFHLSQGLDRSQTDIQFMNIRITLKDSKIFIYVLYKDMKLKTRNLREKSILINIFITREISWNLVDSHGTSHNNCTNFAFFFRADLQHSPKKRGIDALCPLGCRNKNGKYVRVGKLLIFFQNTSIFFLSCLELTAKICRQNV